jgi:EmrB/QacA subfamily drug resistance transporter
MRPEYARAVASASLERRRTLTLIACIIGSSLAFIDATAVIVALPTIEEDLDLGLAGQQWVFLSYSLALASLYLVGGSVGDRAGRRTVFVAGVIGFAAASLLAGIAPNGIVLIAARTLQGVAGAFLTTNSLALLRAVYGDEAGKAIGRWTAYTSLATIVGPPAGGAIAEWTSWRWIFLINLPLAVATVVLARAGRCDERKAVRVGRLDIPGAVLAALGFGFFTYGAVEGADRGFGEVWWAFVVSAASLVAFAVVERRVKEPMLPFALFRRRNLAAANVETFLAYAALYGFLVYFTLFIQSLGFTPFETGLITTPPTLVMIALAARFGALADKHGPRLFLAAGPALIGVAILLTFLISSRDDFWLPGIASLVVFSFGLALMVAPITAAALKSAPAELAGIASGVNATVSRLGSLTAVAVIGLVVALVFDDRTDATDAEPLTKDLSGDVLAASVSGYRAGMLVAVGLAFGAALVGALWISNREALEPEPEPTSAAPAPAAR